MISRKLGSELERLAKKFPVVTVTGPRQSGKTTLCRQTFPDRPYVNLESLDTRDFARTDPRGFLGQHSGGTIIDEVQRVPELLSYIQTIVDETSEPGQYILTGSANLTLLDSVSQSLAGRTALLTLLPCSYDELKGFDNAPASQWETVFRGSYPAIYQRGLEPHEWYDAYVGTYIERDVRAVREIADLGAFKAFMQLMAGRTGQLFNASNLSNDVGVSANSVRAWLSVLETCYIATQVAPYHANIKKRLTKAPKIHFYDTGLVCFLLGIHSAEQLAIHPLRGNIFESWVISDLFKQTLNAGKRPSFNFYRDSHGNEVDLIVSEGDVVRAVEIKSAKTIVPSFFRGLDKFEQVVSTPLSETLRKVVVYGGEDIQHRTEYDVMPWNQLDRLTNAKMTK